MLIQTTCDQNHQMIMTIIFSILLILLILYLIFFTIKPQWLLVNDSDNTTTIFNYIGCFVLCLIITILILVVIGIIYVIIERYKKNIVINN